MSAGGARGGRRIPTPMPPPKEGGHGGRSTPRLVGTDASYKLSPYEIEALNAVKQTAPKMDRNGYFFYVASTAKKKKISLMQPRPPRVAFLEEKRRPGVAERISVAPSASEVGRVDSMSNRGPSPAPRARLYSQLESYQPRYHTIRDQRERESRDSRESDKRVDSECRRRKKEQRIGYQQGILSKNLYSPQHQAGPSSRIEAWKSRGIKKSSKNVRGREITRQGTSLSSHSRNYHLPTAMVVTRSQGDVAEGEREAPMTTHRNEEERLRIELERARRLSIEPPASPTVVIQDESTPEGGPPAERPKTGPPAAGPTGTHAPARSVRSTNSVATRMRLAELEAAEKIAAIKRREMAIEADLVRKQLAVKVSLIHDEEDSLHEEPLTQPDPMKKVDEWLNQRGEGGARREERHLHFEEKPRTRSTTPGRRARSPTPTRSRSGIDQLAEALERMARPRVRHTELPVFSGAVSEWLPFKAAMRDTTRMYGVTPAENIQRLRSCLRGEARDAVAALLHTAANPDAIMKTLEQSFGRPEVIIDRTLDELRKMPKPGPLASELNSFAIKLQNSVCVLQTIDKKGYLYNPMLAREILGKLSPHITSRWCDYADEHEESGEPEIVVMSRFLMREADRALKYTYSPVVTAAPAARREVRPAVILKKKTSAVYSTTEDEERTDRCLCCELTHTLPRCPRYESMTVDQRWELVKEKKMCFKCISSKHRRITCKAKPCGVNNCRRPHHSSLHTETQSEAVMSVADSRSAGPQTVLLKMCPVIISGPRGEVNTYALLDEGATVTLVDEELARSIGADGPAHPLHLHGVNMSQQENTSKLVSIQIRGKSENAKHTLRARTVRDLRLHEQSIPTSLLKQPHLEDLIAKEACYERARPGILVGTDHWEVIVSRELRVGRPNQPAASRTQLGWVIHGTAPRATIYQQESVLHLFEPRRYEKANERRDDELHQLVEEHFKIEALGVSRQARVNDADQRAIDIVKNTIKKIDVGYEVGLPWRNDDVTMPPSYNAALRRLKSIEQKMDASPSFAEQYTDQIQNLLKKGYAVQCDGSERTSPVSWYLPHFAVQNINKPGKQRLVFDAAAKSYGVSLNDHLLDGPDLLLSLQGILLRFREKPVAITADIQEMFLRIRIRPEDQPAQQFLWRGADREGPPQHYKMVSMIFGAASSPFMAHYVRDHNARRHAETHPRALDVITRSHYMDDLVASYETEEEARLTIEEVRAVHQNAGFTLRSWSASDPRVLRDVPAELHATAPTPLGGAEPASKILGLVWNPEQDELGFNTSMSRVPTEVRDQVRAPTKREALSAVMSIYDPLGLLSQYTIRAKIVLQNLWRLKMAWDEPIPAEEQELFASWLSNLDGIASLRLPRCYTTREHKRIELHILCDASEQAYAAVAYWRVTHHDGSIDVILVAGKSKVAPRRTQTIPRLELQAAVIGARLADAVKKEHRYEIASTTYWTDSSTVVHWIRHDARRYTPFVAHRLGEIAELTQKEDWRWLPTELNVADDATRFTHTPISNEDRWFRGPRFLTEPEESWPAERFDDLKHEEVLHVTEEHKKEDWLPDPARFSKYETLVRATARALAFIDICRRRSTRMEHEHIERAERALLQKAQRDSFQDDLKKMRTGQPLTRSSRLYKLDPVLEDGLLRVRGRIGAATAPDHMKTPLILDGRHRLTQLIVLQEHCAAGHANRERVTNDLRQRYWVIHLRPTVRAVERDCTLCRARKSKPQPPAKGDLPRARLDPFHRPFTNCGVDYFGPMIVKVGRRREKRWGALFTCLTTRAVHLELVASLSTDSAIMALRRMAARRGWPRIMYSDNATNFRGADQELKNAYAEWAPVLRDEGLLHRMEWRFIPPGAPNQGGAWERLVRSVKSALGATLHEKAPSEEVLLTLLAEAEFSINARPLTHVSVDPLDPEALTPNHFLLGSSTGLPTTGPCDEADRRTWRAAQALADHFWRRWLREYLPTLVPRGEPTSNRRPIQVGDVVAVVDHTLPRNIWPRGLVQRTYAGPDGGIRVVDVKTKTGIFKRPVSKLVVLPGGGSQATPGGECCK